MDRWPAPHPGRILTLPIMGTVIKVPHASSVQRRRNSTLVLLFLEIRSEFLSTLLIRTTELALYWKPS